MSIKKKLIEVALPLEAINKASARANSIRHWHPSTLHPFDRYTLWLIWPKL
jgi:putative DNA methylase